MTDPSRIDPRLQFPSISAQPAVSDPPNLTRGDDDVSPQEPYYLTSTQPTPSTNALDPTLEDAQDTKHVAPEKAQFTGETAQQESKAARFTPEHVKRPRACDSCRGLKVKCEQDPQTPSAACRRCAKAGRQCITTPPARRRTKKADSRVAELERKIDALTASLHAQRAGIQTETNGTFHEDATASHTTSPYAQSGSGIYLGSSNGFTGANDANYQRSQTPGHDIPQAKRPRLEVDSNISNTASRGAEMRKEFLSNENADFAISAHREWLAALRQVPTYDHSDIGKAIDEILAPALIHGDSFPEKIVKRYIDKFSRYFPAVPLPPSTTASELRESKPILFLAILASTSFGIQMPNDCQRSLVKLMNEQFASSLWRHGEKSLELVQALQVSVFWYRPPLHFEQHNFFQSVTSALVMALDLGLGRPQRSHKFGFAPPRFRGANDVPTSLESRRALLVCYYLCMTVAMILRRPIMLPWTKVLEDCVSVLQSSSEAFPSDHVLIAHVKLMHICEKVASQFSFDDQGVEISIANSQVAYAVKIFENDLRALKEQMPDELNDPVLKNMMHTTSLYIHEVALHYYHNVDEFRAPFGETLLKESTKNSVSGPVHAQALAECVTACHGILDSFINMPFDITYVLPIVNCVRTLYALVCLMKIWAIATGPGEVGSIIRKEDLRVETYVDGLLDTFQAIVNRDTMSPHAKFFFIMRRLKDRFTTLKEGGQSRDAILQQCFAPPSPEQRPSASSGNTSESVVSTSPQSQMQNHPQSHPRATPQPQTQTPLHLLSEVAMGNSNPTPGPDAATTAAMQAQQAQQQAVAAGWYDPVGVAQQHIGQLDTRNMGIEGFDLNASLAGFDFGLNEIGVDGDFSSLFMWGYNPMESLNVNVNSGSGTW